MTTDDHASDVATAHAVRPHMEANGLTPLIVAFPKTIESLEDTLHMAADFGAPFVDVIGQVMPIEIKDMVPVIETWDQPADPIDSAVGFSNAEAAGLVARHFHEQGYIRIGIIGRGPRSSAARCAACGVHRGPRRPAGRTGRTDR